MEMSRVLLKICRQQIWQSEFILTECVRESEICNFILLIYLFIVPPSFHPPKQIEYHDVEQTPKIIRNLDKIRINNPDRKGGSQF